MKIKKYWLFVIIISVVVAILIHFPESVSLFDTNQSSTLFPGIKFIDVANEILFTFFSLLFLFSVNTFLFHYNQTSIKITGIKILLSFFLTWLLSNLSGQFFVYLHKTFNIPAIDAMGHHYLHPLRDFIMACLVTGSCYIIYLINRQQLVLIENQRLQSENIRNQFEALKNQLNPHMLFNSLNTLGTLVRENQDRAQDYIQELSKVLRYMLQSNESQVVSLKEEIEFASAYMFLLKVRFENNLQFDIKIDKSLEENYLPPMSIQLLIENAVKHNEISSRKPLTIYIKTDQSGNISVYNTKHPKWSVTTGTGIGLVNLAERYRLLIKKEIQIEDEEEFKVIIPLIKEKL